MHQSVSPDHLSPCAMQELTQEEETQQELNAVPSKEDLPAAKDEGALAGLKEQVEESGQQQRAEPVKGDLPSAKSGEVAAERVCHNCTVDTCACRCANKFISAEPFPWVLWRLPRCDINMLVLQTHNVMYFDHLMSLK